MNRCFRALVVPALVLALVGAAGAADHASRDFGPLALRDLAGVKTSLEGVRGKVVVLNFWATWCKPCLAELPELAKLAQRFRDRGLVVIAVSIDDAMSRSTVQSFAERLPEGMDIWVGATGEDMRRLRLGQAVPVTVVLDREGGLVHEQHGSISPGSLDKIIEGLLATAPQPKKPPAALPGIEQALRVWKGDGGDARTGACQAAGLSL